MNDAETMDIEPEELRDGARRLLADKVDRRAGWGEAGGAAKGSALSAEMAELGWTMLTAPADRGGLGQSFAALAPVYEEIGRALSPVTIAGTMAAVDVLAADGGEAAGALLDRIVGGEARVAIGFVDSLGAAATLTLTTVADAGEATDLLLIAADGAGLVSLAGATVEPVDTWDRTRAYGDIRLTDAAVAALGISGADAAAIARAHLDLARAWDSIGAAQQTLDEAVAYMGTRKQFDRPIGSFQALKHRAADHKVAIEVARALAARASSIYAARGEGWADLAGQARLLAVDAFRGVAEDSVQFHGGIGFTWEHDCHLFLKRALMNEALGEGQDAVRDRVAPGIMTRAMAGR